MKSSFSSMPAVPDAAWTTGYLHHHYSARRSSVVYIYRGLLFIEHRSGSRGQTRFSAFPAWKPTAKPEPGRGVPAKTGGDGDFGSLAALGALAATGLAASGGVLAAARSKR